MKTFKHEKIVCSVVAEISRGRSSRWRMSLDKDDLLQAGRIGAWRGELRYISVENVPFKAYIAMCVRWAIYDELRRMDYVPRKMRELINSDVSANVPFSGQSVNWEDCFSNVMVDNGELWGSYYYGVLLNLLESCDLGPRPGILTMHVCGLLYKEIASIHGISIQRISQIIQERKEKFKRLLDEVNYVD